MTCGLKWTKKYAQLKEVYLYIIWYYFVLYLLVFFFSFFEPILYFLTTVKGKHRNPCTWPSMYLAICLIDIQRETGNDVYIQLWPTPASGHQSQFSLSSFPSIKSLKTILVFHFTYQSLAVPHCWLFLGQTKKKKKTSSLFPLTGCKLKYDPTCCYISRLWHS